MKTFQTYITLILLHFSATAFCQATTEPKKLQFNEKTVVIDTAGKPYSYTHWQYLLKSGRYEIPVKKLTGLQVDTAILIKKPTTVATRKSPTPDINSIVADSSGREYAYEEWKKLVAENEAWLWFKKGKDTIPDMFHLIRFPKKEKLRRDSLKLVAMARYKPKETEFFTTGEKVKGLKFKDLTGKKYRAEDLQGKIVVFNFWFINCPPCRAEIPDLNKLVEKYKENQDVVFLAVATDEEYALEQFLKRTPFNFNIIPDGRYTTLGSRIRLFPTHLVVGRDGTVLFHTSGGGERNISWVEKTINEALAKKEL
jgi:thiol-disulfide isomerase/thioredoxin